MCSEQCISPFPSRWSKSPQRRVCVSGLGTQAGEQSWFRDVLEGAPAVLSSHLCPAATAGSHSQVLCAEGWFWLETNPRPLLLPNHFLQRVLFTHPKFQQSAGYCSAWEALKMWLRTGTCISISFSVGKAGGQAVRSCNKPTDLCYVHQDVSKGKKKWCWEPKFLIHAPTKPTCSSWGNNKRSPNTHIY